MGEHECFVSQSYPLKSMKAAFPFQSCHTPQTSIKSCSRLNQVNNKILKFYYYLGISYDVCLLVSWVNFTIHALFCRIINYISLTCEYGVYTTGISILLHYSYWAFIWDHMILFHVQLFNISRASWVISSTCVCTCLMIPTECLTLLLGIYHGSRILQP